MTCEDEQQNNENTKFSPFSTQFQPPLFSCILFPTKSLLRSILCQGHSCFHVVPSPLLPLFMMPQSLRAPPKPSAPLPWAAGSQPRSPCFLLLLIRATLMSLAASLPCLLDTNKSLCSSGGTPFTHNKLCVSVL